MEGSKRKKWNIPTTCWNRQLVIVVRSTCYVYLYCTNVVIRIDLFEITSQTGSGKRNSGIHPPPKINYVHTIRYVCNLSTVRIKLNREKL